MENSLIHLTIKKLQSAKTFRQRQLAMKWRSYTYLSSVNRYNNNVDILFLQEMWLHENDFKYVNMINKEFLSSNVSGIRDSEMIYTRGYGRGSIL